MTKKALHSPDAVRETLRRHYARHKRHWLAGDGQWPLSIGLGRLGEADAARHVDVVRAWIGAWQAWRGIGVLAWREHHWRTLGAQRLPERLLLESAEEVAAWLGEKERWQTARSRYHRWCARWPVLKNRLALHFEVLAEYAEMDFNRLESLLVWLSANPASNLYPRQLPIAGLDSKWLESRRGLIMDLMAALREADPSGMDFYQCCGLRPLPSLMRMRMLDPSLRECVGGLGDIAAPVGEVARLMLPVKRIFIVENLQTGLAFGELPGAAVFMGLGYGVDLLAEVKWLQNVTCIYWGDLDTHGFAILSRARAHLPHVQSLLMDEETLLRYKDLWVEEKQPHPADRLPNLTDNEQNVYSGLKQHRWGHNVRLEQERIAWPDAWNAVRAIP